MGIARDILIRLRRWIGASLEPARPSDDEPARPPAQPAAAVPLHVVLDAGLLRLDEGRLVLVTPTDGPAAGETRVFLLHALRQVSIHGRAGITTPALAALMARGVPVVWRDGAGFYRGQAMDCSGRTTEIRRAQFRAQADPAVRLAVARTLVGAKIVNGRGLLRRRGGDPAVLARLAELAAQVDRAGTVERLMGLEGVAAGLVFAAWPTLMAGATRRGFAFAGRRRRPASDPVNALLSYAYAVLVGECAVALHAAGLDPHAGFLHAERPGRPALALDLVEPLRSLVAERAVLRLLNRGAVTLADFEATPAGTRLSDTARRALLAAIEARLAEAAPGERAMDYRTALCEEAHRLAAALRAGAPYVCGLRRG